MMTPMWISLFKVLLLLFAFFATTSADSAPFMPIPTQHDDPTQKQKQNQDQSPIPETNRHYHQYHSLIQPDQYFKRTDTEVQSEQPIPPRHPSDTFVFPDSPIAKYRPPQSPARPLRNDTKEHNPCAKDESQHLRNFCTNVDDYPDLSGLRRAIPLQEHQEAGVPKKGLEGGRHLAVNCQ
nr:spatzle alternatively spliced isoform 8.24 [Drosophila melanogaster]